MKMNEVLKCEVLLERTFIIESEILETISVVLKIGLIILKFEKKKT